MEVEFCSMESFEVIPRWDGTGIVRSFYRVEGHMVFGLVAVGGPSVQNIHHDTFVRAVRDSEIK